PIPKSDFSAANLLVLSLGLVGVVGTLTAGATALWATGVLPVEGFSSWAWLIPLGVTLAGLYSAGQLWASRFGWFGSIARTRVTQVAGGVLAQIGLGLALKSPVGLVAGHALSGGIGGTGLLLRAWRQSA